MKKASFFSGILPLCLTFFAFSFQNGPLFSQVDLDRGLVGYWPFDSSGLNKSVNRLTGNDFTLYETSFAHGFDGQAQGAVYFYGKDSYGRMEHGPTTRQVTFGFWFNTNAEQGGVLMGWDKKGYSVSMMLGGRINVHLYVTNNFHYNYIHEENLADGKWHHVVGSFDGETFRVYIDGVKMHENKQYGSDKEVYFEASGFNLGGQPNEMDGRHYTGLLDEFVLHNRALTENEVYVLYCKGKLLADNDLESGMLIYLPFEYDDRNTSPNLSESAEIEVYGGSSARSCVQSGGSRMKYLNGDGDYLSGGPALEVPTFTLAFWMNTNSIKESFVAGWDTTGYRILLNPNGKPGKLFIQVWLSKTESYTFTSVETLNDGQCHHVALTFDGQVCRVFIDGSMKDEGGRFNSNRSVYHAASTFLIGSERKTNPHLGFQGTIDEVYLYNRALDKKEITNLKNGIKSELHQHRFYDVHKASATATFLSVSNFSGKDATFILTDTANKEMWSKKLKPGEHCLKEFTFKVDRKNTKVYWKG